jgi:hypothetical protein
MAALCVGVAGVSGCAARPEAPPAAGASPERRLELREPATVEEAQAQLEQARAQLTGAAPTPTTPATGATVESAPGAGGATSAAESPPVHADSSGKESSHRCGNACVAMTSMRHAVDAICRMAGETDARCTDARKTLKDSETRVTGCGCPPT